ncbi:uncharacterized protein LOC132282421 [Cornus florida]|uniref:uncharacterized protein LOC132282421 n=1 Tax=Cornus florida TaxID=4283 RepID=UPI002898AA4C|nr:uncharacterized protein LOC132282421 [Cornus florida]
MSGIVMDTQCTSFLPGCYSTRDLKVGANSGTWPPFNNDRTPKSEHTYSILLPPPATNQYSGCDKKMMRQTMLMQEATFRDQVQELHRLYRRQRKLMDQLAGREISEHQLHLQTFQSNPLMSQNSFEYPDKTWQIPSMPWINPAGSRPSVSNAENLKASSNLLNRAGLGPAQTEKSLKDCNLLEYKCKNTKRRILDLELPADEYINSEEREGFREEKVSVFPEGSFNPPKGMLEVFPKSDLKLFPCEGQFNSVYQGGSSTHAFSRGTDDSSGVNGPIWLKDAATPSSVNFLGSDTYHRKIPCWDLDPSAKLTSGFQILSKEVAHNIETGRNTEVSKVINLDIDRQWQLLPHNEEAGQSRMNMNSLPQISTPGKLPMPSKSLQAELRTEIGMVNQLNKCDGNLWSGRTNFSLETCIRNDVINDNYPGLVDSFTSSTCQLVSQSSVAKYEPASLSPQRKPIHSFRQNPIAVQALPCFNVPMQLNKSSKSSLGCSGLKGNNFHVSRNSRCSSPSGGSVSHLGNSFNHLNCSSANGSASKLNNLTKYARDSDCKDENSAKGVDLNLMPPSCLLEIPGSQPKFGTATGVKKFEELVGDLPWLREKPDYNVKTSKEIEDFTRIDSVEPKSFQTTDCLSNEKSFGSSNFDKPHVCQFSALTSPYRSHPSPSEDKDIGKSENFGELDINLLHNPASNSGERCTVDDLVEVPADKMTLGVGNHIDLNSCINEDDLSAKHTVPTVVMKALEEIDLEAPVSPENKESSPPRGKLEKNQLETHLQLLKQDHEDPQEELIRMAAEVIVEFSSFGLQKSLEDAACEPLVACPGDSLQWFAGVVSSAAGNVENEMGVVLSGDHKELSSGSDSFERMTMKLTETEVEENCCGKNGQKEEETGEILSPSQPKRGRSRKGRLHQDFQTDVLPSLASLSRHEVKKDLQTIGGLMEAAATLLVTGSGRRNGGRNGCTKARRRSSVSPSNVIGSTSPSLLKQQSNDCTVLTFGARSLTGWGKKNRRQRGQRFPARNPAVIFC